MNYSYSQVKHAHESLANEYKNLSDKKQILKSKTFKDLFSHIKNVPAKERRAYGVEVNSLKTEIISWLKSDADTQDHRQAIDITAPFAVNTTKRPQILTAAEGSKHPLSSEIEYILDIFYRMGFTAMSSRLIDNDYHMFESLNFPEGHPARDDYDTFMTTEGLIAPAHTSTMQNRALLKYKENLENGEPIAVVVPDRVFRNEDLDATHEHTFHQIEGLYVGKAVNVGNLIAVLQSYLSEYFGQDLKAKIQPFYFPFTEPSFEFAVERPAALRKDNTEAEQWLELGGCGMIHPNVLKHAGIDPTEHTGFAFGFGIERMVMLKAGIEDVRHFESGKLEFLRQF